MSGKPYEVIYDRQRLTAKSSKLDYFYFGDSVVERIYNYISCTARIHNVEPSNIITFKVLNYRLIRDSYVIENLPAESDEKCGTRRLEAPDVILWTCEGKMIVRPN